MELQAEYAKNGTGLKQSENSGIYIMSLTSIINESHNVQNEYFRTLSVRLLIGYNIGGGRYLTIIEFRHTLF